VSGTSRIETSSGRVARARPVCVVGGEGAQATGGRGWSAPTSSSFRCLRPWSARPLDRGWADSHRRRPRQLQNTQRPSGDGWAGTASVPLPVPPGPLAQGPSCFGSLPYGPVERRGTLVVGRALRSIRPPDRVGRSIAPCRILGPSLDPSGAGPENAGRPRHQPRGDGGEGPVRRAPLRRPGPG
jgi:hypothetical protein